MVFVIWRRKEDIIGDEYDVLEEPTEEDLTDPPL